MFLSLQMGKLLTRAAILPYLFTTLSYSPLRDDWNAQHTRKVHNPALQPSGNDILLPISRAQILACPHF